MPEEDDKTVEETLSSEFSKWLSTTKTKARQTADFMKKDLYELKELVAYEVAELSTVAKKGLNTAVTNVTDEKNVGWVKEMVATVMTKIQFLGMEKTYFGEEDEDEEPIRRGQDFWQRDEEDDGYRQWKEAFRLGEHMKQIREIMDKSGQLRKSYLEQVPDKMKATDFWAKYFYAQMAGETVVTQPGAVELCSTQEDEQEEEEDEKKKKEEEGWLDWDN